MRENKRDGAADAPLNPALKSTTETSHNTEHVTPAPIDTASTKKGEGEGWPLIWLGVFVLCLAVTIYLVL